MATGLMLALATAPALSQPSGDSPFAFGPGLGLLLVYVLLALFFSFLCSVAEAVLLSITPSYIAELRERDPKQADRLQNLKGEGIDRSLAAILTVNTIAHTVGAIGAGAKATSVFGDAWFGVFSAVMTLLILFLSEIVPKTIGAVHWRRLSGFTVTYVNLLIKLTYPLIVVSELVTRLIARGQKVHVFSRDEFIAMADVGQKSGQIDDRESKIIRNLFRFKALTAEDIMTPRTVMVALQADMTVGQAYEGKRPHPVLAFAPVRQGQGRRARLRAARGHPGGSPAGPRRGAGVDAAARPAQRACDERAQWADGRTAQAPPAHRSGRRRVRRDARPGDIGGPGRDAARRGDHGRGRSRRRHAGRGTPALGTARPRLRCRAAGIRRREADVFADAGYRGVAKREEVQAIEVNWHVAVRPGKRKVLDRAIPLDRVLDDLERCKR